MIQEVDIRYKTLTAEFFHTRKMSEYICAPLHEGDFYAQPHPDVSPPKWHLAHTTWFFETFVLVPNKKGYKVVNKDYSFLFNSYYENVGKRVLRVNRGNTTRPSVKEIMNYRKVVNDEMMDFLDQCNDPEILRIVQLGIQHEQQHQELLITDIKYILGTNPLFPVYQKNNSKKKTPLYSGKEQFLHIDEGVYEIGYKGDGFSFDNESGVHKTYLHEYRISSNLVTNKEYLEFIADGGYQNVNNWLSDGWEWVKQNNIEAPLYWYELDHYWLLYNLKEGLSAPDPNAPVAHVNYYEADAYARWKGKRLATEFEWETAAKIYQPKIPISGNFLESGYLAPVHLMEDNNQFFGNVWEWTNSAYLPYPFYKKPDGALGEYNGKFMINQMVLKGGSCATPQMHIRHTYRNFFQPDKRWQFTGIRLAENL